MYKTNIKQMETYNSEGTNVSSQQVKKPGGLIFAGILSILNAIFTIVGGIGMILVTQPNIKEFLYDLIEEAGQVIPASFEQALNCGVTSGSIAIIGAIISFIGVVGILMLKRNGFYIYVFAQAGLIVAPIMLGIPNSVSIWGILLTALFIGIYASFWKLYK